MRQILKEAITVALFIDEIENDISYNKHDIPQAKLDLVRKVVNKFLKRMKETEYHKIQDQYGETYYRRIVDHVDTNRHERSTAVYLTYIQMQFHDFIRHYLPKKMGYGGYRRNVKNVSYYKKTLEMLMR